MNTFECSQLEYLYRSATLLKAISTSGLNKSQEIPTFLLSGIKNIGCMMYHGKALEDKGFSLNLETLKRVIKVTNTAIGDIAIPLALTYAVSKESNPDVVLGLTLLQLALQYSKSLTSKIVEAKKAKETFEKLSEAKDSKTLDSLTTKDHFNIALAVPSVVSFGTSALELGAKATGYSTVPFTQTAKGIHTVCHNAALFLKWAKSLNNVSQDLPTQIPACNQNVIAEMTSVMSE